MSTQILFLLSAQDVRLGLPHAWLAVRCSLLCAACAAFRSSGACTSTSASCCWPRLLARRCQRSRPSLTTRSQPSAATPGRLGCLGSAHGQMPALQPSARSRVPYHCWTQPLQLVLASYSTP